MSLYRWVWNHNYTQQIANFFLGRFIFISSHPTRRVLHKDDKFFASAFQQNGHIVYFIFILTQLCCYVFESKMRFTIFCSLENFFSNLPLAGAFAEQFRYFMYFVNGIIRFYDYWFNSGFLGAVFSVFIAINDFMKWTKWAKCGDK